MTTDFGQRMKWARKRIEMTQEQLSAASGIRQSTVGSTEAHGLASQFTAEFAQALGVDAYWLATGKGDPITGTSWPFKTVTRSHIEALSPDQLETVEKLLLMSAPATVSREKATQPFVENLPSGKTPEKTFESHNSFQSINRPHKNKLDSTSNSLDELVSSPSELVLSPIERAKYVAAQHQMLIELLEARIVINNNLAINAVTSQGVATHQGTVPPRPKDADSWVSAQKRMTNGPTDFVSKQPRKKRG